jgi:ERCC4-type nuclease
MPEIINIFAKNQETHHSPESEKIPKPVIIADHREKNSLVLSELVSLGIQIKLEQLEVADFLVNNIAIERKVVSDFLSSMISKRLSEQLMNMQQYEKKFLIIEGIEEQDLYSSKDTPEGMNPNAVRGFLLDIILKYQVPIIFAKNYKDTARFLSVLVRKPENQEISLRAKRRVSSPEDQKQYIMEGFPGLGPKTAKKLLKEYGSIKNIINASQDELEHSLGKKSQNFRNLIS